MATNTIQRPKLANENRRREKRQKEIEKPYAYPHMRDDTHDNDVGREWFSDKNSNQFMYPSTHRTHTCTHMYALTHASITYHFIRLHENAAAAAKQRKKPRPNAAEAEVRAENEAKKKINK